MHAIEFSSEVVTESEVMDMIFKACRANVKREPVALVSGFSVSFMAHANGIDYSAVLRDPVGVVVAFATVDEFDS